MNTVTIPDTASATQLTVVASEAAGDPTPFIGTVAVRLAALARGRDADVWPMTDAAMALATALEGFLARR